jgi:hypothetical protein
LVFRRYDPIGDGVDSASLALENGRMEILGRIHNGVVILEGNPTLPEGAVVSVTYPVREAPASPREQRRVEFPLVRSVHPGSVQLTSERIHEILEEAEIEVVKVQGNVPP